MPTITSNQFRQYVANLRGARIVTLITRTNPSTINPYYKKRIVKVAKRTVMLNANYENCVNNQRAREGHPEHFYSQEMWGGLGEHSAPNLMRHKNTGKEYLIFYPIKRNEKGEVMLEQVQFFIDGKMIATDKILPFLAPQIKPKTQETEKMIPWRVVKLNNVKELHIDGDTIIVG